MRTTEANWEKRVASVGDAFRAHREGRTELVLRTTQPIRPPRCSATQNRHALSRIMPRRIGPVEGLTAPITTCAATSTRVALAAAKAGRT